MIATSRFVFLHLHKSGGTFVNEWLLRFWPDARPVGYHLPRHMIPAEFSGLPVIGLVRNPWSYYVSWYTFQSGRRQPNALFRVLSEGGRLGFEATIRNMLQLGSGGEQLPAVVGALPAAYTNSGLNLPGRKLEAIRDTGLGFYSFLYRYMYSGEGPIKIARMEGMRDELPALLSALGETISPAAALYLAAAPATNTTAHSYYAEYYGAGLRDLVGERDADVIGRHGYRFGDPGG